MPVPVVRSAHRRPVSRRRRLVQLGRDVSRRLSGHDVLLYSAGLTFYAVVAVVPLSLLALYLTSKLLGPGAVQTLTDRLAGFLPERLDAARSLRSLARTGPHLPPVSVVTAVIPAGLYGEGLVRALDRLSRHGSRLGKGLRGRVFTLAGLAILPLLTVVGLTAVSVLPRALGSGLGPRLLGIYVTFLLLWVIISMLLGLSYRFVGPETPGLRALLWGAASTGSMVAGCCLGFVLFLGIEVDIGAAYGGNVPVAAACIAGLFLYLVHAVVLVGYVLTLCLDARAGHPLADPVGRDEVRAEGQQVDGGVDGTVATATVG